MIKFSYLPPYEINIISRPPVIMPESESDRKKGQAYVVLAPSIESEFQYLARTMLVRYRFLTRYFLPKRTYVELKGMGTSILEPNEDNRVQSLLDRNRRGSLANISGFHCYIPKANGAAAAPMRGYNTLVEVNHLTEAYLQNPKDRRIMSAKARDWLNALSNNVINPNIGNFEYTTLLPLELWFKQSELTDQNTLFRAYNQNPGAHLLQYLCNPTNLKKFGKVMLQYGQYSLTLEPGKENPKKSESIDAYIHASIVAFIKKIAVKKISLTPGVDAGDTIANVAIEDDSENAPNLLRIEKMSKLTEEEIATEDVLTSMNIDPDSVAKTTKERVRDAIVKNTSRTISKMVNVKLDLTPSNTKTPMAKIKARPKRLSPIPSKIETVKVENKTEVKEPTTSEKIELPQTIDKEAQDAILNAQMEGRSVASEKRNQLLRERYKELSLGDKPLTDLIEENSNIAIPDTEVRANTINESLQTLKAQGFEDVYDESLAQRDLVSILMHFASAKPAMFLNKNIEIQDVSTRTDRILRYHVEFEDEDRKRHSFFFKLPKMYQHKFLYLNGQELEITHQKLPFPITKVQPDRCQLVTSYNKIFVYRYGTAISPRIIKLKKILGEGNVSGISVRKGDCTELNRKYGLTTIEFDEFSSHFTRIDIGRSQNGYHFMFDPELVSLNFDLNAVPKKVDNVQTVDPNDTIEDKTLVPLATSKVGSTVMHYWVSGTTNQVYDDNGKAHGELSDFMVDCLIEHIPNMEKELADTSAGSKFMYSRVRIMAQDIPLVLVVGAADPNGFIGALEKGKIKYTFVEKRPIVDKTLMGVIQFRDGYLVYDRYPLENSLFLNGLACIPTKEYNFYDLNTRDAYVEIFDDLCGQRTLADNMQAFYYMMIDPITKDVLNRLNMPTDFTTLLFWCNGVLADNQFQIDSNYENSRIRSNEIILVHLYRELAIAWSQYKSGKTDSFSINEDVIIKLLLTSKIVDPKSKLNITLELENDRNVKLKGPSGMNEDHSFTIEKRAFHPSMRGIVGTNSVPSGEVGINRHMVVNPNINDARGFITVNKKGEYDGTELCTPGELLTPFSIESADIERLCMSISQAKHVVPVKQEASCPVSYDFERIAPYMSRDFAFVAKQDGKVIDIQEDIMVVQYKDGSFDDIDLSDHPAKNTDGGFHIMNKMDTKFTKGKTFKKGEILAYDKKTINDKDFFGDPTASVGILARVCFEANGTVYEDAGYITDSFAHKFATKITKQKRIILSKFANVKYIAKVGQEVKSNDLIMAFDDTEDEFSSKLLAAIASQADDEGDIIATTAPILSKYTGVIKDIDITYTVPVEEMSPSLRKIVEDYSKQSSKREKFLSQYIDVRDANTIVKSSSISIPDSRGKVGGTKIGDGVMIDFYIEYEDVAGQGDKGSITALKFTTCNVVPDKLAGFTESNPDRKIDVYVAAFGAFKRMVADAEKIGILNKVLIETKRQQKEKYHERIKAELKKMK